MCEIPDPFLEEGTVDVRLFSSIFFIADLSKDQRARLSCVTPRLIEDARCLSYAA